MLKIVNISNPGVHTRLEPVRVKQSRLASRPGLRRAKRRQPHKSQHQPALLQNHPHQEKHGYQPKHRLHATILDGVRALQPAAVDLPDRDDLGRVFRRAFPLNCLRLHERQRESEYFR